MIVLAACDDRSTESNAKILSASACAKQIPDGTVVECDTNHEKQTRLSNFHELYKQVDSESPGPTGPNLANIDENQLYKVKSVTSDNAIVIDSGEEFLLAGVQCKILETNEFLTKSLMSKTNKVRIAIMETGFKSQNTKYAYIWEVMWFSGDTGFGPSLSSTNETAITSGYCDPIEQPKHNYSERYEKLSAMVQ